MINRDLCITKELSLRATAKTHFGRIAEMDVLYVHPKGEGHGWPESISASRLSQGFSGLLRRLRLLLRNIVDVALSFRPEGEILVPTRGRDLKISRCARDDSNGVSSIDNSDPLPP